MKALANYIINNKIIIELFINTNLDLNVRCHVLIIYSCDICDLYIVCIHFVYILYTVYILYSVYIYQPYYKPQAVITNVAVYCIQYDQHINNNGGYVITTDNNHHDTYNH